MLWLYRMQQRLSITRRESWAILSLLGLFLLGVAVQEVRRHQTPPLAADAFLEARAPVSDSSAAPSHAANGDAASAGTDAPSPPGADTPVDLNQANSAALQTLPGIGPALAGRIVQYRTRRPFQEPAELERVSGIGPKTMQRLLPLITVAAPAAHAQTNRAQTNHAATNAVPDPAPHPGSVADGG